MIFSDFLFNHQISIIAPVSFVSKPPWNQEHTQKKNLTLMFWRGGFLGSELECFNFRIGIFLPIFLFVSCS